MDYVETFWPDLDYFLRLLLVLDLEYLYFNRCSVKTVTMCIHYSYGTVSIRTCGMLSHFIYPWTELLVLKKKTKRPSSFLAEKWSVSKVDEKLENWEGLQQTCPSSCPEAGPAVIACVICTHTIIFEPLVTENLWPLCIICCTALLHLSRSMYIFSRQGNMMQRYYLNYFF